MVVVVEEKVMPTYRLSPVGDRSCRTGPPPLSEKILGGWNQGGQRAWRGRGRAGGGALTPSSSWLPGSCCSCCSAHCLLVTPWQSANSSSACGWWEPDGFWGDQVECLLLSFNLPLRHTLNTWDQFEQSTDKGCWWEEGKCKTFLSSISQPRSRSRGEATQCRPQPLSGRTPGSGRLDRNPYKWWNLIYKNLAFSNPL